MEQVGCLRLIRRRNAWTLVVVSYDALLLMFRGGFAFICRLCVSVPRGLLLELGLGMALGDLLRMASVIVLAS